MAYRLAYDVHSVSKIVSLGSNALQHSHQPYLLLSRPIHHTVGWAFSAFDDHLALLTCFPLKQLYAVTHTLH